MDAKQRADWNRAKPKGGISTQLLISILISFVAEPSKIFGMADWDDWKSDEWESVQPACQKVSPQPPVTENDVQNASKSGTSGDWNSWEENWEEPISSKSTTSSTKERPLRIPRTTAPKKKPPSGRTLFSPTFSSPSDSKSELHSTPNDSKKDDEKDVHVCLTYSLCQKLKDEFQIDFVLQHARNTEEMLQKVRAIKDSSLRAIEVSLYFVYIIRFICRVFRSVY